MNTSVLKKLTYLAVTFAVVLTPLVFSVTKDIVRVSTVHAQVNPCPAGVTPIEAPNNVTICSVGGVPTYYDQNGNQINQPSDKTIPPQPTSCTGSTDFWSSPFTCTTRWTISIIGAAIIQIAVLFLNIAGGLFSILINKTVIAFSGTGGFFTPDLSRVVDTVWTAFRDISNILIIGFFTYIAINTILGITEYGAKKLIARVLIVAILINFSLLFTKIIIDASNFTALQFYNASIGIPATTGNTPQTKQGDLGYQFINVLGVSSFGKTTEAIAKFGENNNDNIIAMILYSVAATVVVLGAAAVLFYGCFILASRAILLIFLMITASLAFTTYLIPALEGRGWKMWRSSLLESAVLAPILMLLLWATLAVAKALKIGVGNGTLGKLVDGSGPPQPADLGALFSYLVVLGLLFASFKVASSFASHIAGFNWAQWATAAPFALGSKYLASPLLRNTVGAWAYHKQDSVKKASQDASTKAGYHETMASRATDSAIKKQHEREAARYKEIADQKARKSLRMGQIAGSSMNAMNTGLGKELAKNLGLKGVLGGASAKGGYTADVDARAKQALKRAEVFDMSNDDKEKMRDKARQEADTAMKNSGLEELLKSQKDAHVEAEKHAEAVKQERTQADIALRKTIEDRVAETDEHRELKKTEAEALKQRSNRDQVEKQLREQLKTVVDPGTRATVEKQLQESAESRVSEMRKQANNIETARTKVQEARARIGAGNTDDADFNKIVQAAQKKYVDLSEISTIADKSVNEALKELKETQEKAAVLREPYLKKAEQDIAVATLGAVATMRESGARAGGILGFKVPFRSEDVANKTMSLNKKSLSQKRLKDMAKILIEEGGADEGGKKADSTESKAKTS